MPSVSAISIAASTIFSTLLSRSGPRCGVAATPQAKAIPLGSCSIGSSVLISPSYIVYVIYCVLVSYPVSPIHRFVRRHSTRERGTSMTTDGITSDGRTPSSQPGDRAEPPAIAFTGVSKAFGSKTVLEGFDLQVNRGEVFALLGAHGDRKSV